MDGGDRKPKIPEPPVISGVPVNLLSSVAPPSQLPNFVTTSSVPVTTHAEMVFFFGPAPFPSAGEVPAIPLSKGEPMVSIRSPEDSQSTQSPESLPESISDLEKLGDVMPGSGLLTWVKGAVSSGGILQRVAEKAKSSVDSMITTLDPQMKEYLKSGGDMFVVVASDKEVKISPIREAFQTVFGKATVVGYEAQSAVTAAQPVSAAAAYAAAKQRIALLRATRPDLTNNVPIVAVESYIYEAIADRWFEVALLVLSQPSLGVEVQLVSQGAPVAGAAVAAAQAATPPDYEHAQTGYSLTIGSIMADSLHVPNTQWHEATTGVSRREVLLLAAKSIAGTYKRLLAVSAAET
ncbi:hypothetical protein K1T71_010169 [Dendrolimus kikuchii]|uniref:Uncharacterized protein n=1 Tax=Dendrolimus kikuchii TaxID=765133 RepID=A0ACC1CQW2_9NEOP|nr:hypothetical protein K1T71_010169 [Dendrolimus kikuchii]